MAEPKLNQSGGLKLRKRAVQVKAKLGPLKSKMGVTRAKKGVVRNYRVLSRGPGKATRARMPRKV